MLKNYTLLLVSMSLLWPSPGISSESDWRKPGLWNVALWDDSSSVMRAINVQQCTDARTDPEVLLSILPAQENCAPLDVRREGGKMILRSRCKSHDADVSGEMILTGDLGSAYQGEAMVSFKRGFASAVPGKKQYFKGKWLGACRPGMVPGDMLLSNGIKVHVLKAPQAPKP